MGLMLDLDSGQIKIGVGMVEMGPKSQEKEAKKRPDFRDSGGAR